MCIVCTQCMCMHCMSFDVRMYDIVCTYGGVIVRFVRGVCDKMDGSCLLSHKVDKSKVRCCLVLSTSVVAAYICGLTVHSPSFGHCRCLYVLFTCVVCVAARNAHICMLTLGGMQRSATTSSEDTVHMEQRYCIRACDVPTSVLCFQVTSPCPVVPQVACVSLP